MSNLQSSQGIVEFDLVYNTSDFQQFVNLSDIKTNVVTPEHFVGFNNQSDPTASETMLDIEWISSSNSNATNWIWIEPGTVWMFGFATHFVNTPDVPLVVSIS